ncbi:MAG TPA: AI-2E family transporter [Candidatus Nanoarchaeia archaeon]|nr:AI-2E family transporter [Candidatus Nanoarchaeia archaeon]
MKAEINRYIKYALIIILAVLAFVVVQPYVMAIVGSIILAYMVRPVQRWLKKYLNNETLVATIITIALIVVVLVPLAFLASFLIQEAAVLYQATSVGNIEKTITSILNIELSDTAKAYIEDITRSVASFLFSKASAFLLSVPEKIINVFIALFVLFYTLRDGEKLYNKFISVIPIPESYRNRFVKKFETTVASLFYGEITLAFVGGIVATVGFYFLGVSSPIIWGIVVGLAAILPGIGPTIAWVPLTIIAYVQGDTTRAILIGLFGFLILSLLLDTLFKAHILGIKGKIHPLVIMVGVLGGLTAFGLLGLILGPLILVLLEVAIEIYMETKDEA